MLHLGIDCGLNGAIVALKGHHIVEMTPMPTMSNGKKSEIDINRLSLIFEFYKDRDVFLTIEDTGGHAPSAAGLRSMTYSFAVAKTLAVVHRYSFQTVLARKWQRSFWSRPAGSFDTKAAALKTANELWPDEDWRKTERSKKAFDGFVDAALIAEYGRRAFS
jgi:hypothetical protein